MRSERARLVALVSALLAGGCSFEWDALRPGPDAGARPDVGASDTGASDTGPSDTGASDTGPSDTGAADTGATDTGVSDAGVSDVGAEMDTGVVAPDAGADVPAAMDVVDVPVIVDLGPRDTGVVDVGTPDTGPRDSGVVDVGTPDTGPPPCTGPLCPCSATSPSGWCAIGATCTSATCMQGPVMGALVITEIMNDPMAVGDLQGEWFEVYNRATTPVDLRGMRVRGSGSEAFEVTGTDPLLVPGRGYAVLGKVSDTVVNGSVTMLFAYGSAMDLSNSTASTDVVTLLASDGSTVIDSVTYANTVASGWPTTAGRSKSLRPETLDASMNDVASAWCAGGPSFGAGDRGTPGAANVCQ